MIKYESEGANTFLVAGGAEHSSTHTPEPDTAVYRYDSTARTLTLVPRGAWDSATGRSTARFDFNRAIHPGDWSAFTEHGALSVGWIGGSTEPVATHGKAAALKVFSWDHEYVAVLTADGALREMRPGILFGRAGGYRGQHYIEVFKVPDMKPVSTTKIPFITSDDPHVRPVWSSDNRFIVLTMPGHRRIAVVHTGIEPKIK